MALVPSTAASISALQAFAGRVGLGDDVVALEEKLRNASLVLDAAREMEIRNEALVESLPELQDEVYGAEEVLDVIDYFRMKAELDADVDMLDENEIDESMRNADVEMPDESDYSMDDGDEIDGGSDGSSDNCEVSNLVDLADVAEQGSSNALVSAHGNSVVHATRRVELDKDELLLQICEIGRSLGQFADHVCEALKLEELDRIALAKQGNENRRRLTTPYLTETKIYGRDLERDQIVELLTGDPRHNQNFVVLPIVGNGGIGKTALAQYVYSDPRVKAHFDTMMWVCVSLNFDIVRLTTHMLECITGMDQGGNANLTLLQEMLKDELKGCRVLLVLDDIWDIKDSSKWSRLVAPLGSNQQGKGNAILVTTRNQSVATAVCTLTPIALYGLRKEDFRECFRAYAFGGEKGNYKLHSIGRKIADRLKGYPLAAKSVGGLLRKRIDFDRWSRIFENNEWISNRDADDSEFEKDLIELNTLQRKKLKSLMLFGSFGSTFATRFHFVADVICNLRTLRISGIEDDGDILSGFGHCIHLRYLRATRQEYDKHNPWLERYDRHFPKELCRLYRLQFLNVGVDCYLSTLTKSFSNLVNLRHFICHEENHSELSEVSKLASLQELRMFRVRKEAGFHMEQLANLSELGSLSVFGLENLVTKDEATNAKLLDREHLRSLCLNWDASRMYANPDMEKDVLEGLQPHAALNHLQISGYMSASLPTWLGEASSFINLRSIHLEDCQPLRSLPPFVHLKCLKKLHLSRIYGTTEVSTHSLEELIIEEVEQLERWIIQDKFSLLAAELQVLEIKGCPKLRELPFSCSASAQTVSIDLFPLLHHFIIHDCPLLMPLPALPLGPKVLRMTIVNVGSPLYKSLSYYQFKSLSYYQTLILDGTENLTTPNGVFSLHNLGALSDLSLRSCSNLTWFSWEEVFQQLGSMKKLNFVGCPKLLSMPAAQKEEYYNKDNSLPALENLTIESCCIRGNRLAHVLSLLPSLSCLELTDCPGEAGDECMLMIPIGSLTSLKELCITNCIDLSCGNKEGFIGLTSLETLRIGECPKLLSSLIPDNEEGGQSLRRSILLPLSLQRMVLDGVSEKLLPLSSLTSLKDLGITDSSDLKSIDLHSCTSLEEIGIHRSGALSSCKAKGVQRRSQCFLPTAGKDLDR
ncbi:Disease resistance protein RGA2 [Dichanthelium oligosanthes]|uniref:Disease resistance protein RGA2 n=1 Tax=Dichanthelium oligosanthes TaxID=888268 RepID=A0A1E5US84_9POAL|nr:Disease resistance protein RGA2 [Dichanthelium oligosanthes]